MKRLLSPVLMLGIAMLFAPAAESQRPDQQPGPAITPQLIEFLRLDGAQARILLATQRANAEELAPLNQARRANGQALRDALQADPVDDGTVGRLVREGRELEQQFATLRQAQRERAVTDLNLTMEQRDRLQLLQQALRVQEIALLAARLNLVAGPPNPQDRPAPRPRPRPQPRDDERPNVGEDLSAVQGLLDSLAGETNRIGATVDRIATRLSVVPAAK